MVPFAFENIPRSATYDASHAVPLSDAARATHESFESHLQRAPGTSAGQPTRGQTKEDEPREPAEFTSAEPPGNESVRQDASEPRREDGEARATEDAEATTASETSGERIEEDVESDAAPSDVVDIGVAVDELVVAVQNDKPEASSDAGDDSDRAVAAKVSVAPTVDEKSELGASLATNAGEPAGDEFANSDDDASAGRELKRGGSNHVEPADPETPIRQVKPLETKEDVAVGDSAESAPAADATIPDDESPPGNNARQRHAPRVAISPNKPTRETVDAVSKPNASDVVETAADTASEEFFGQRQHHRESDGSQSPGKTAAAETTAPPGTPSRFAQHLLARTEDPNARGVSITNADQARFVDRVARAVQATGERQGTLRLRLSPPELGSLTLEVKVQGGVVSARIDADTPAARSLLLEHLPLLRERLAEHGMRVDQFDVDLADRQAGGTPDGLQQHDQQQEDRPRAKAALLDADEPQTITHETPIKMGNEQLNIIV